MASIVDNYEINVAKKRNPNDEYGDHFCKIQLSDAFEADAESKLDFFRTLFGEKFNVTMIHWVCRGELKDNWN